MINEWVQEGIDAYVRGHGRMALANPKIHAELKADSDNTDKWINLCRWFNEGWDLAQVADMAIVVFETESGGTVRG